MSQTTGCEFRGKRVSFEMSVVLDGGKWGPGSQWRAMGLDTGAEGRAGEGDQREPERDNQVKACVAKLMSWFQFLNTMGGTRTHSQVFLWLHVCCDMRACAHTCKSNLFLTFGNEYTVVLGCSCISTDVHTFRAIFFRTHHNTRADQSHYITFIIFSISWWRPQRWMLSP